MDEKKTYVAVVAHEHIKVGDVVYVEPTPRMEALLGAGYYTAADATNIMQAAMAYLEVPDTDPHVEVDWVEAPDDEPLDLTERFEDQDIVEVIAAKPKRVKRS